MSIKKKLYLVIPPILFLFLDATITLMGQTVSYWTDHSHYMEGNPVSAYVLSCGPGYFVLEQLIFALIIIGLSYILPKQVSLLASITYVLGHSFGFLTWLIFHYGISFWWMYLYFPFIALMILWQVRMYSKTKKKKLP